MSATRPQWAPTTLGSGKPAYVAIADAIADDIRRGRLAAEDQLPPQRQLADTTGLNFSTISRAYAEAHRRGLIEARVGQGTFVRADACPSERSGAAGTSTFDMSMNLPPEPDDPGLVARMESTVKGLAGDLRSLLRYQPFGGSPKDRKAGTRWLERRGLSARPEQTLVCGGTHSVLNALLIMLGTPRGRICCDALTYTGARALAAVHGITLEALEGDSDGVTPEALDRACRDEAPVAFYCNPTIQNPTTITQSLERRQALIAVARRYRVPIVEDDVYGLLPDAPPPAYAALAPELTYHIGGLSKTLGAGLRLAYLVVPDMRSLSRVAAILRATTVMAPPLSIAIATEWINNGTAADLVAFVRAESRARQKIAAAALSGVRYAASPDGFHLWLPLPEGWSRVGFAANLRASGVGVVTSDAFQVGGVPVEAVRICLGGVANRLEIQRAFEVVAAALSQTPQVYSSIV
jgi:DNA-binding transcriptional MocR family regulator